MAEFVQRPAPLHRPGYLARITRRDGPAVEEAMAGATLFTDGARLDGAIIEAAYAFGRPPLLKRLADDRVVRIIDLQSLRFAGGRYLETKALKRLPYAPSTPISPFRFGDKDADLLVRTGLEFAQDRGTDLYLAPAVPLFDRDRQHWARLNSSLLQRACALNGAGDVERRPLLAQIAPGNWTMTRPEELIESLLDQPVDGVYIQGLRLNPVKDSLEKLARFVQFAAAIRDAGFPVIVGRVGAFGLVLQALGIPLFDSGLGQAEAHDLASLNRPLTARERQRRAEGQSGGPQGRVYLEPLKTTLPASAAREILACETVRARFACTKSCCRFRPVEDLPDRARTHYLHVRRSEVDALRSLSAAAMRLHQAETELRAARDLAAVIRRSVRDPRNLPDFHHLDRWLGLLTREQQIASAA